MQTPNPVIQSAKVDALFKFEELVRSMAKDADNNIVLAITNSRSGLDQQNLAAARKYLQLDANPMLKRMVELFREQMDRAMRTMYTDLRTGLGNLSADTMTLIDDETVNRQIEVGHLVDRLRNACDENLGRLNIMIAQLNDDHEVRERENPFRPYLIARTLHDVLRTMVDDEKVAAILFDHLSATLENYLPGYYAELSDVFQAAGVQAQLRSRPTALKKHQRMQMAQQARSAQSHAGGNPGGFGGGGSYTAQPVQPESINSPNINPQVMPGLQRLLELMQQQLPAGVQAGNASQLSLGIDQPDQSAAFQDFVWNIFNQAQAGASVSPSAPPAAPLSASPLSLESTPANSYAAEGGLQISPQPSASQALLSQLNAYQQLAAQGEAVSQQISPDQNQLFSVRDQIGADDATKLERVAIDVIAVLFEFILDDEQIPAALRLQIGRLQIPFLKAAMLAPELLQQADHPTRQLLNRMGTAAVGSEQDALTGQNLASEITRIVKKILSEFDKDIAIFSECVEEFDLFLAKNLRNADAETALSVDAMEEAEAISVLTANTTAALRDILAPMTVDQRIVDFILNVWTPVLVRASLQEEKNAVAANDSMLVRYRELLPELVWSAQEKQTPADRSVLMRLLPTLVRRIKTGLLMIHLPEKESQQALDQLVAVHTQILRNAEGEPIQNLPSLEALRQLFSALVIDANSTVSATVAQRPIQVEIIEYALAERGIDASLDLKRDSIYSSAPDTAWLAHMQMGTQIECLVNDKFQKARLIWISKYQTLYMFKLERTSKPKVYSAISLSKSLHEGSVCLIEAAPTFERAVEALLIGAESIQPKRT